MDDVFAESIQRPRFSRSCSARSPVLALLLAAIGTYGVLVLHGGRAPARDRDSDGARRDRSPCGRNVMTQGLLLTGIGLIAGLAGALALTRLLMASLLFGVQPTDPTTIATVVTTIAVVAALACGLPAWRASRVDPIVVLRDE